MKETNIATASLPQQCRPAVKELLKEIYGYTDFRDFEVYNDLSSGKDKLKISQGQLIEEVIEESEKSMKTDSVYNFLLTAPTGAGKSLLFQLPAIYLGQEYKLLTIVISPLKALIVDQVENLRDLGYGKIYGASKGCSRKKQTAGFIPGAFKSGRICQPAKIHAVRILSVRYWARTAKRDGSCCKNTAAEAEAGGFCSCI